MPVASSHSAEGHAQTWHRRGQIGFAGALLFMVAAAEVTGALHGSLVTILSTAAVTAISTAVVLGTVDKLGEDWSLLLWPVATIVTLLAYTEVDPEAGALVVGLIPVVFLHVGLCQPPGRGLWLLAPASLAYAAALDMTWGEASVRMPLAVVAWAVASELPARLIEELRIQHESLRTAASTDPLTGLLNRSTLDACVEAAPAGSAIAVIDIDHFKQYNDTHGHIAGDVVLADFAMVLVAQSRAGDRIFRFGGEEFLVIFHATSVPEAALVVERYAQSWTAHVSGLSFSAGVTSLAGDGIRRADELLYRAKRDGRNRVIVDGDLDGTSEVAV